MLAVLHCCTDLLVSLRRSLLAYLHPAIDQHLTTASEPAPLPPSSHPFASASGSSTGSLPRRTYNSSRHSRLQSFNNNTPASPAPLSSPPPRPPPTAELPPLPSSVTGHRRNKSSASRQVSGAQSIASPNYASTSSASTSNAARQALSSPNGHLGTAGTATSTPSASSDRLSPTPQNKAKSGRTPSRQLLQSALDLAKQAVEYDRSNNVEGALASYNEAVSRLRSVMSRVGVEPSSQDKRSSSGRAEQEGRTLKGIHDAYLARIQLLVQMREGTSIEEEGMAAAVPPSDQTPAPIPSTSSAVPAPSALAAQPPQIAQPPAPEPEQELEQQAPQFEVETNATPKLAPSSTQRQQISPASDLDLASDRTPRQSEDAGTGIGNLMLSVEGEGEGDERSPPFQPRELSMDPPSSQSAQSPQPAQAATSAQPIQPPPRKASISATTTGPGGPFPGRAPAPSTRSAVKIDSFLSQRSDEATEVLAQTPIHVDADVDRRSMTTQPSSLSLRRGSDFEREKSLPALPPTPLSASSASSSVQDHSDGGYAGLGIGSPDASIPINAGVYDRRKVSAPDTTLSGLGGLRINTDHTTATSSLAPPVVLSAMSSQSSTRSQSTLPKSMTGSLISPVPEAQPAEVIHRPFHLLRTFCLSMDPDSTGSYLTGAVHISSAVWKPSDWSKAAAANGKPLNPPRIASQEVKARILEALVNQLEGVRATSGVLLDGTRESNRHNPEANQGSTKALVRTAEELCGALDALMEEMDVSYKALNKAGVPVGAWKGKARSKAVSRVVWLGRASCVTLC